MIYKYVLTRKVVVGSVVFEDESFVFSGPESYWIEDCHGQKAMLNQEEIEAIAPYLHIVALTAAVITIYDDEQSRAAGRSGSTWFDAVADERNNGPNVTFSNALESWLTKNKDDGVNRYTMTIELAKEGS